MAVAVVQGSEVVYRRGFGVADLESRRPVTADTVFYIASTTKAFTAFAAALLAQRGELDLDAPLGRLLPSVALKLPLAAGEITLRHLLTHTHGITDGGPIVIRTAYTGDFTNELLLRLLGEYEASPKGRAFAYGNLGYNVAGLALDARFPAGWKELLAREIFAPLGMAATSALVSTTPRDRLAMPHAAEPTGFTRLPYAKTDATMHAAGGMVSTASDLAVWLEAHLNRGTVDGRQVFPAAAVAETHRKQADQDRTFAMFHRFGWGLGWDLDTYDGDTLVHRFGSFPGFRSHVSFMPERGIGVVVLTNGGGLGSALTDFVATAAYDTLLDKPGLRERLDKTVAAARERAAQERREVAEDRAQRAGRPRTLAHPLAAYAGTYHSPSLGCLELRLDGGTLRATMGTATSAVEVYDGAKDQLRVELTGGGEVVAVRFAGDAPQGLAFLEHEFARAACPRPPA